MPLGQLLHSLSSGSAQQTAQLRAVACARAHPRRTLGPADGAGPADGLAPHPFFLRSLPLCFFPRVRPCRHDGQPVATTPTMKPQLLYTEHLDLHHLPHSHEHTTCLQTSWKKPHPTMVARWPRCPAPRRYKPLKTKLRAWEALVAHHEHSCAAGRRG
jgi:hypothetical protein